MQQLLNILEESSSPGKPFESLHGRVGTCSTLQKRPARLPPLQGPAPRTTKFVKKLFLVRVWQHWLLLPSIPFSIPFYTLDFPISPFLGFFSGSDTAAFPPREPPARLRRRCLAPESACHWVDKVHSEIRTSNDSKSVKVDSSNI